MEMKVEMRLALDPLAIERAITRGVETAMPAVAESLREAVDQCFEREATPWGAPWTPLLPSTIAARERDGKAGKILQRDGVLRGSLASEPTAPTPGVTRARVIAGGPAAAYAGVQQWGNDRVPPRPYMPLVGDPAAPTVDLPSEWREEALATVHDSIEHEIAVERQLAARAAGRPPASGATG